MGVRSRPGRTVCSLPTCVWCQSQPARLHFAYFGASLLRFIIIIIINSNSSSINRSINSSHSNIILIVILV